MKQKLLLILVSISLLGLYSCQKNQQQTRVLAQFFDQASNNIKGGTSLVETKLEEKIYERPYMRRIYEAMLDVRRQTDLIEAEIQHFSTNQKKSKETISQAIDSLIFFGRHKLLKVLDDLVISNKDDPMKGVKFDEGEVKKLKGDLLLEIKTLKEYQALGLEEASWAEVAVVIKSFENRLFASNAQLTNYLSGNMGCKCCGYYDKFDVFSTAPKAAVEVGESYEADISLGAFSSNVEFSVAIGGNPLRVEDGKARFENNPKKIGKQSYTTKVQYVDTKSRKIKYLEKIFFYSVLPYHGNLLSIQDQRLHLGIANSVYINYPKKSVKDLVFTTPKGVHIRREKGNEFSILVNPNFHKVGDHIQIKAEDKKGKLSYALLQFKIAGLQLSAQLTNGARGGKLSTAEMQRQKGLLAAVENQNIHTLANIHSFELSYTPKGEESIHIENRTARFQQETLKIVKNAKAGDLFLFHNIRASYTGVHQELPNIAFLIN